MKFKLEICVDSFESALNAQSAGADRIELCDNLTEGGTTPSAGLISSVRENLSIGLNVIIRPRGGDFLYSDAEFDIMRRDIEMCGENGVDGVVFGLLLADGTIDVDRTGRLAEFAHPMEITFHRAFDVSCHAEESLENIILTGATRLLTSGQRKKAAEGSDVIARLVEIADGRIIIMPGGGLDESNIAGVALRTKATEFHLTARSETESSMIFRNSGIHMGSDINNNEYLRKIADTERIKKIISILKMI
ncbi:MAG TPA: copper homeostasis protein CutC [Bacteroidales bacterium]|nr:copper homeostasis protein CutC [Bacteroidales bacterium]HPF03375.1 copper homeostasis protein CutC [Bacteroidales bacterium]HPJ58573.1 copper homeostasis protein CutC [Bacteroidales bacterium]HPR11268.1 copper homeostasis protein CutC [Bacteroidales bacterium]HRW86537.1 copper homeostasis protein CutC [Bacteroidales bacterium]